VTARKKQDDGAVVLTRDEAALIRRALADCHEVIARAGTDRVVLAALQEAALGAPGVRRPLDQVRGASLAIDHIDFPRLAGRST
jgi:hypothetical protein